MFQTGIIKACLDIQNDGIEELKKKVQELEDIIKSKNIQVSNSKKETTTTKNQVIENSPEYGFFGETEDVVLSDNELMSAKLVSKGSAKKTENKAKLEEKSSSENKNKSSINWQNVLNKLKSSGKIMLFTSLANTRINQVGDMIIEIEFPNGLTPFVQKILEDSANKKDLEQLLIEETGKDWHIKYKDSKSGTSKKVETKKDEDLGIDINIID